MSRCFPFPSTGYTRNGSCSEALIESIKLRSQDKKSKNGHKKDISREKKEKRRERKETPSNSRKVKHEELKLIELEKFRADKSNGSLLKVDFCEDEHIERSDITEEHDLPVSWSEPCCSDSIQSGCKRKRSVSPPSSHNGGTGIKLRFSFKKHQEPVVYRVNDRVSTASRGLASTDLSAQDTNGSHLQTGSAATAERDQSAGKTNLQSSLDGAASNKKLLADSLGGDDGYQSLFQNWVPLPLFCDDGYGYLSEDQDWLFSSEPKEERSISKRPKPITTDAMRCSGQSMWPCAQYLPEVEVYALPYAIPF